MESDHLIEIVFENVARNKIGPLLKDITSNGNVIVNYYSTCNQEEIDWKQEDSISTFFKNNSNCGLFINLKELKKIEIEIPNCSIAIYENQNRINFELSFSLKELKKHNKNNLAAHLMEIAQSIANQYQIAQFFCGLEPAKDLETRFFTNDKLGPLSFL